MKKQTIIIVMAAIILGGAAFYGGLKYGQSSSSKNLQQRMQQQRGGRTGGMPAGFGMGQGGQGGGFVVGEILSKDANGVTLKMRDGGSKIIFVSGSSTEISKFAAGTLNDLTVGENVSINGKANADGSITAQSVQIRPKTELLPPPPSQQL